MQSTPPPPPRKRRKPSPLRSNSSGSKSSRNHPKYRLISWIAFVLVGLFLVFNVMRPDSSSNEVPYSRFLENVAEGCVEGFKYNNDTGIIRFILKSDQSSVTNCSVGGLVDNLVTSGPVPLPDQHVELIREQVPEVRFVTPETNFFISMIPLILPIGLLILFFWWMQRKAQGQVGNIMSIGRSRAKTYATERPDTTFDDVAGYENVKQEITEVVDFLKKSHSFVEIGARVPKGVLLVGPPGTGKTLIAKAVAGEAGVPFLSVTGSDFMEMFVGVGASRVRDLFDSARKLGKAIIFIDEIDSIGRKRGAGLGGGHDEREQTLNQMLSEMDGFEASEGIVLMAATNRPDILDPALLRPGRFDRQVIVPLPELSDRVAILKVHTKGKRIADDVDLDVVARSTPGMSGADLANLINEAALYAVRDDKDQVMAEHIEQARDRIVMGIKRESMALTDDEKKAIAYHEAGHAVCAAVMPTADPLHKVTIIPSGMALGVTMQLPENDRHLYRSDYMLDRLVVMFGGRVAEEIVFGIVSTGAGDDLVKATAMARSMVREWGMSDEIGPMAWGSQEQVFLGENLMQTRDYSDTTARVIDEEIERILREQLERCRQTLLEYSDALDEVARSLLEHETIDGKAVERIVESSVESSRISQEISAISPTTSSV
ncbi:MAG: ATP-dependent zinc metalloprotease FtsH [Acidimicrobiaceae bacterium]|nr:ATP-dependent zinc metalloprotease FtsH [Acidimicrobiaceae bacterium]